MSCSLRLRRGARLGGRLGRRRRGSRIGGGRAGDAKAQHVYLGRDGVDMRGALRSSRAVSILSAVKGCRSR